jgi:hypothetical protein
MPRRAKTKVSLALVRELMEQANRFDGLRTLLGLPDNVTIVDADLDLGDCGTPSLLLTLEGEDFQELPEGCEPVSLVAGQDGETRVLRWLLADR